MWEAIGARGDGRPWYDRLTTAYAEAHRHYHNQRHIAECLREFDAARHLVGQAEVVELGIWFHDAVYEPRAGDNEERSAALAKECLDETGVSGLISHTVAGMVMMPWPTSKSTKSGALSERLA